MNEDNLVDDQITAERVKVVDQEGSFVGEQRIEVALSNVKNLGLNLVQITDNEIPVCKMIDYGRFLYERKKKSKNVQKVVVKEIKMRPFIEDHDLMVKVNKINGFLGKKNKVKVLIGFKGREISHSEIGFKLVQKIIELTNSKVTSEPTLENNNITFLLESK